MRFLRQAPDPQIHVIEACLDSSEGTGPIQKISVRAEGLICLRLRIIRRAIDERNGGGTLLCYSGRVGEQRVNAVRRDEVDERSGCLILLPNSAQLS